MNKKEVLNFLNESETAIINQLIAAEIDYRMLSTNYIANPKDDRVGGASTKAKQMRDMLQSRINYLRQIRKEIEEDRLII